MDILINGLTYNTSNTLYDEGFSHYPTLENDKLYSVALKDSVILKAGYHITLDKGGKLFTLYTTEFNEVRIV